MINNSPHRGRKAALTALVALFSLSTTTLTAQVTERERPAEWAQLVEGACFMDRFLPMPQATLEQGTCEVTATVDGKATVLGKFTIQP